MEWTFTRTQLPETARRFIAYAAEARIFAFHGSMGAGKTTFIHALCNELDVRDVIGSPTFSLINEYEGKTGKIYHMDLYRLNDVEEAVQAGIEDCLYAGNICFVEWPERAPGLFPDETIHAYLEVVNEDTRRIRF